MGKTIKLARLVVAGTHSGAGKTSVTLGLALGLQEMGLRVQGFKAGPDYLDPSLIEQVTGQPCYNLDTWMLDEAANLRSFAGGAVLGQVSLVEGVMGLYDGSEETGAGSTASLARLLDAPVLLVVDAKGMAQSAAAVVLGYRSLDPKVRLAGVLLNRVGSPRHFQMLKKAIESKTRVPVVGYFQKETQLELESRHLGLVSAFESRVKKPALDRLLAQAKANVDLGQVLRIAQGARPLTVPAEGQQACATGRVRLGVARDRAFHFYYQANLDMLRQQGAELVNFSPLADAKLPDGLDGLYIGGGYPELFAGELAGNRTMRTAVKKAAAGGMPIYGECGGLMYLTRRLKDASGKSHEMAGVLEAETEMMPKRQALGYVRARTVRANLLSATGQEIRGHEFHWSRLAKVSPKLRFSYRLSKGTGITGQGDGIVAGNTLASYSHFHFGARPEMAERFVNKMEQFKSRVASSK